MLDLCAKTLSKINTEKPIILNLINYASAETVANTQQAVGASPMISCFHWEIPDLIAIASALYINIGTLDTQFVERTKIAIKTAKEHDVPIIIDPQGAGASQFRTDVATGLLQDATIIRGNITEILALYGTGFGLRKNKKDNASDVMNEAQNAAVSLAKINRCVVAVSATTDFITDGRRQFEVPFGSPVMGQIMGLGCSLTGVIAAFNTLNADSFEQTCQAVLYYNLCGTLASLETTRAGSFKHIMIDHLHAADFVQLNGIYRQDD